MARPRRTVQRVQSNLKVDERIHSELLDQAADSGVAMSTYLEHVVSYAHRYDGPYLSLDALPAGLQLAKLRRRVKALDRHGCQGVPASGAEVTVRLDEPLARSLQVRARGFGVPYTAYLRAVLHAAAKSTTSGSSRQLDLGIELADQAGEGVERRRAS